MNQINKGINMNFKLLKLAKMIMNLAEIETDKGVLTYEGELVEGTELFIEKEGEIVPAEDGEYVVEDKTIVVAEGKVKEIIEVEKEPEVEETVEIVAEEVVEEVVIEEPKAEEKDEKDLRIEELEAKVAELEAIIAEKDAVIAEQQAKLEMSADESPKAKMKKLEREYKDNPSLKYFESMKK